MRISYEHRAFCAVAFLSSALFQDGSFWRLLELSSWHCRAPII
jgi:hypothetical protein